MQWFYAKGGTQHGPVPEMEMRRLIESREVAGPDLVWRDGMESWKPLSQVSELSAMLPGPSAPPSAVPGQPSSQPVSPYAPPTSGSGPAGLTGPPITSYLWQSIVVTLLCCMPAGVVAIVYAARVEGLQRAGDIEGARRSANLAKTWVNVSVIVGILVTIAFFMIGFFSEQPATYSP